MKWTIDSFPTLRDFCREHEITFTLTYSPCYHTYKFVFKERWVFVRSFDEHQLDKLWLPGLEKELIDAIKKEFNIYDSAVAEHIANAFNKKPWTVDDLPDVRDFCKDNHIMFVVYTYPNGIIEFIFDKSFKSKYFFKKYESELEKQWLHIFERKLIDTLKAKFNIYDSEYDKVVKIRKDKVEIMKRKESIAMPNGMIGIKKVIFNDPATIIIWTDDVKTIIKAQNESYDPEKGMAMAIAKRALGNEGNYYDIFKKWIPKEEKKEPEVIGKVQDVTTTDDGVAVEVEVKSNIQKVLDVIDHPMDSFF